MAHVKGAGTTGLGRDSQGQRLGVKLYGGQTAKPGNIIVRQRGTKFRAGENVERGADDTLFATIAGKISYKKKRIKRFDGSMKETNFVSVIPAN